MNWKFWKKTEKKSEEKKKKSALREWADAIVFAVVAATLIRWLIMEAYTIPTPSMENSLLVGDFLFVSKFHYGTRTPKTVLQLPLTHQKIWFTNIPSYLDWIQLPQYRLPGFTSVKRNDVVVFNVPGIEENNFMEPDRSKWKDYPVDLKTNYIKRCVALPGDVFSVENQEVVVNGDTLPHPELMQFEYMVTAGSQINQRVFERLDIDEYGIDGHNDKGVVHRLFITPAQADELSKLPFITSVTRQVKPRGLADFNIYPMGTAWNGDFYGPITIPKEGWTIPADSANLVLYGKMIQRYDHNPEGSVKIEKYKLYINGEERKEYTFKQDYYVMMGDNRHNSLDSRYWGFVPADHIVGKGFFIWLSIDKNAGFFNKIRWRRFFKPIR
jgi:signal peptidase I